LVILASAFGFSTFPVSADIPVVYEIISSGFVVPFAISAAVTSPSSGLLIPFATLALAISPVSIVFLCVSPTVVISLVALHMSTPPSLEVSSRISHPLSLLLFLLLLIYVVLLAH